MGDTDGNVYRWGAGSRLSRRDMLQAGMGLATAAAVTGVSVPRVAGAPFSPAAPTLVRGQQAQRGGTLQMGLTADAEGLDPAKVSSFSSVTGFENVYSSLLRFDKGMNVIPELAEKWEISPDNLRYTFHLRKGIKFHNGRPFVAKDVQFSLMRLIDKATGSPNSWGFDAIDHVDAPDDGTAIIVLKAPYAPMLNHLAEQVAAMVPEEEVKKHGDLQKTMVGTGPFTFVEWVPGTRLKLQRNPNYWEEGLPYMDAITFQPIPDDTARSTALRTGTVDFIEYVPQKDVPILQQDSNLALVGGLRNSYGYVGFNTARKPFDNVKVRQAFNWAVDPKEVVDVAAFGFGDPLDGGGPLPKHDWAYAADLHVYKKDIEKAKQLMAEAGYPNGFKATIKGGAQYDWIVKTAESVAEQVKPLGVELQVIRQEWGLHLNDIFTKKDFDAVALGWIGFTDPDDYMYGQFHSGQAWNFVGLNDPQVDHLLDAGRATLDQTQRKQIYHDLQARLLDLAPYIFLYTQHQYEGLQTNVKGFEPMANASRKSFRQTWLAK